MKAKSLHILLAAVLCLASLGFSSCKDKATQAREEISQMVSGMKLPKKVNSYMTLTECSFTDNTLTIRNEVAPDTLANINKEKLEDHTPENLRGGMIPRKVVTKLIQANADIRYVYYSEKDSIIFSFSASDLH